MCSWLATCDQTYMALEAMLVMTPCVKIRFAPNAETPCSTYNLANLEFNLAKGLWMTAAAAAAALAITMAEVI